MAKTELIKVGNYYVPKQYRFDDDGMERAFGPDDVNASLPGLKWDDELGKWAVNFHSPDSGGYETMGFVWYFDTIEDLIEVMKAGGK